jgi:hypothetical protein
MTTLERYDAIATRLKAAQGIYGDAYSALEAFRRALDDLDLVCSQIDSLDRDGNRDWQKLKLRLSRIRELRNMMEIVSLGIELRRACERAWELRP